MAGIEKMLESLKCTRDEIVLKIHLGSKDLQDEWSAVEQRWHEFEGKAELGRSAQDLSAAARILAAELKTAYARIGKALQ